MPASRLPATQLYPPWAPPIAPSSLREALVANSSAPLAGSLKTVSVLDLPQPYPIVPPT